LRSFHAVATHGSFTRAAEMLNITQPTLSGQVKDKLFLRHGRRIELTDIGKSAFGITRLMFRHEEEIEHLLQSARALTSGLLRVGADSPYIATPLLAQFQRIYPGIQISIQYGNSEQLMTWIVSRRCDVAFMPNIPQEDERLFSIPLPPDRLVAFVSQDHDWAERRSVTIEELVTQRIVLREKGSRTRSIFEDAVAQAGHVLHDVSARSGRGRLRHRGRRRKRTGRRR
jgi:DNA-binding transcriptional LysR family regulator